MEKPQEKHEDTFVKEEYPDRVKYYYESVLKNLEEEHREDVECLVDGVYKAAYLDGFKEALFYTGKD